MVGLVHRFPGAAGGWVHNCLNGMNELFGCSHVWKRINMDLQPICPRARGRSSRLVCLASKLPCCTANLTSLHEVVRLAILPAFLMTLSSSTKSPSYLSSFFPTTDSSKSMSFKPILRPADWTNLSPDPPRLDLRRPRSPECGAEEGAISPTSDRTPSPPRKKQKVFCVPAIYYPPRLSPSELTWVDRYEFLCRRGYALRPRYQPDWTPTLFGNGRHHHSGEDYIMQIVRGIFHSLI